MLGKKCQGTTFEVQHFPQDRRAAVMEETPFMSWTVLDAPTGTTFTTIVIPLN